MNNKIIELPPFSSIPNFYFLSNAKVGEKTKVRKTGVVGSF